MNYRRPWWAILPLLVSLGTLLGLIVPSGCGSGGGGSPPAFAPTLANMAVAFIGSPPQSSPPGIPGFRSVFLNVSAVRLNPSANAPLGDSRWVKIPVSSGAGNGSGPNPGDLQIDLNSIQTGATLFNTSGIPVGTYREVQVVVDPTNPGAIVPACQALNVNQEGCASYPIVFSNPRQAVTISLSSPISASKGKLATLLLQLSLAIDAQPSGPAGAYSVTVTADVANPESFLGQVTGAVHARGAPQRFHASPLSVSAELTGTDTVVAKVPVASGNFTLELPAFPASGTTYDLFVSGGGFTYDANRAITIYPGSSSTLDFNVTAGGIGTIGGTITDACSGLGIPGAMVELLAPPSNISPPADCTTEPQDCVPVAATSADEAGNYPLPGTRGQPSDFSQVPTGKQNLALQASAGGYGTLVGSAQASSSNSGTCAGSVAKNQCSFNLLTGYINGTVTLSQAPPPGQSVQVQVFAENSGTSQLVSALTMPLVFGPGQNSARFSLNVPVPSPSAAATPAFDLFAAAIDPYLGAADPYPGHTIAVAAEIQGQITQCQTTPNVAIGPLDCVGHGSISATVANPDSGTTVEVLEDGVQILGTAPGLLSSASTPPNNQFTLCVPPGLYTLQRFEQPAGGGAPSPGATVTVTVPTPSAVSTPCPSTCSSAGDGSSCPGQCFATHAGL